MWTLSNVQDFSPGLQMQRWARWRSLFLICLFCFFFSRRIWAGQVHLDQLSVPNRLVLTRVPWTFPPHQKDRSGTYRWRRAAARTPLALRSDRFITVLKMRPVKTDYWKCSLTVSHWHSCLQLTLWLQGHFLVLKRTFSSLIFCSSLSSKHSIHGASMGW